MERKITFLQPIFYKEFSCSGGDCKLNCCDYSWKISIDKKTYQKYRGVKQPKELADKFTKYVKRNRTSKADSTYAKIIHKVEIESIEKSEPNKLNSQEVITTYCPFTDENGLCEIYKNLGPNALSATCQHFPRIFGEINSKFMRSLGSGCEEVSTIFLKLKDGIDFEYQEDVVEENRILTIVSHTKKQIHILDFFDDIRSVCISILQLREIIFDDRIILLGAFLSKIDELDKECKYDDISHFIETFTSNIDVYKPLFAINTKRYDIACDFFVALCNNVIPLSNTTIIRNYMTDLVNKIYKLRVVDGNTINYVGYEDIQNHRNGIMKDLEYYIENVFVNEFFSKGYPISKSKDGKLSIMDNYIKFMWSYCYYKMLLSGRFADEEKIDIDGLHRLTALFGRTYADQPNKKNEVFENLKHNGLDSLAHLAIIVKSS